MSIGVSKEIATVVIKDASRDSVLAQGQLNEGVLLLEGNYYFAPELVEMTNLVVTERLYTCPYKGVCKWIDLVDSKGVTVKEVGWVYFDTKPGYERINGRIAFYPGIRRGTHAVIER